MSKNLAKRSIDSFGWNAIVSAVVLVISLFRSVLLARWLSVDVFGIYAGAGALIGLTLILTNFGMDAAFIHHAPETEDEDKAARVLLALRLIFTAIWIPGLILSAAIFTSGLQQMTIVVLTLVHGLSGLAGMASLILIRRVAHRRMAVIQLFDALLKTGVALSLSWNGKGIWALVATDIVSFLVYILGMYVWRPVWKVRLGWDRSIVRYYLHYGSRNFLASALIPALDKVDDLWTAVYLGERAMGYYSRAYSFATYPRLIVAGPLNQVAGGTFAELKTDRLRLSQAFFRTNAFLIRSGFILAGILALIAPELIYLLLGEKWLPMLTAFRLMLIFTLFDPMKQNTANLFLAVGRPITIVRVRLIQLIVLVAGLFILGTWLGIAGVALAVDAMLVVGIAIFFYLAKKYVDFSLVTLFLVPFTALFSALLITYGLLTLLDVTSHWQAAALKIGIFAAVYSIVLFTFERRKSWEMFNTIRNLR